MASRKLAKITICKTKKDKKIPKAPIALTANSVVWVS